MSLKQSKDKEQGSELGKGWEGFVFSAMSSFHIKSGVKVTSPGRFVSFIFTTKFLIISVWSSTFLQF